MKKELIYLPNHVFQWDDYIICINSKWLTNEQILFFFIRAIFTKVPKQIFCTQIPYGHITNICGDKRQGHMKVKRQNNTITLFVFRKVTGDVYGCKILFYILYFVQFA